MLDKLTQQSQALWYTAADRVELRDVDMPPPKSGEVIVKAHFSGISRGTERLVFRGRVPKFGIPPHALSAPGRRISISG